MVPVWLPAVQASWKNDSLSRAQAISEPQLPGVLMVHNRVPDGAKPSTPVPVVPTGWTTAIVEPSGDHDVAGRDPPAGPGGTVCRLVPVGGLGASTTRAGGGPSPPRGAGRVPPRPAGRPAGGAG